MGATRTGRTGRRRGGLIIVGVVAVAAVALVLWVVLRDNKEELLTPTVNTTPMLGNDALLEKFNAAVAVTEEADNTFQSAQAAASAACSCPAGDQDPKTFATQAQGLLPALQAQERQLEGIIPAASVDI